MKLKEKANLALGLAIVMILVVIIGAVCAIGVAKCWFGHEYGEDGICVKCGAEKPVEEPPAEDPDEDGGLEVDPEAQARGMRLASVRIPRPQFAEEGISPLAESAQQLTATVTPADATNKEVDWSIEWNNASSTWAKGKTVTDYVTVTPTADGALTANVACLQPFAEKIVIRVAVRTDTALYAEAVVDYEKRILGFDLSFANTFSTTDTNNLVEPANWSFTTSSLTQTVNFPRIKAAVNNDFGYAWTGYYDDQDTTNVTLNVQYSIYTKDKSYAGAKISVAASEEYINALEAAGLSVQANANQYIELTSGSLSELSFTVNDIYLAAFCSDAHSYFKTFDEYVAARGHIRENLSASYLNVKVEALGATERDSSTIYTVKFSANSVQSIVENITVTPGTITF